jgi:hypothetical protein
MGRLSLREGEREPGASWYVSFRQSPYPSARGHGKARPALRVFAKPGRGLLDNLSQAEVVIG